MACSLEAIERGRVDIPRREAKSGDRANPTRIHQPTINIALLNGDLGNARL